MTPARTPATLPTPVARRSAAAPASSTAYSHVPSQLTLAWLAISTPLVIWDSLYVLLRPHSMPGGSLHWPLWVPYELYGRVDGMYGFKQYNANNGFTGAQTLLNVIELIMYTTYLYLWYAKATPSADKAGARCVGGKVGASALLIGFSAAVMTLSKTVLYCKKPRCAIRGENGP